MALPGRTLRILAIALVTATGAAAQELTGPAAVLDGDTIRIAETRIRFTGVDAPETDQTCIDQNGRRWLCGIAARDALSGLIANRLVRCRVLGEDVYGRKLAACEVAGTNINRCLVQQGLALAYVKYSSEFVADENTARQSHRGMWAGAFVAPWDWRTRTPKTSVLGDKAPGVSLSAMLAPIDAPPDPACAIKGNVNRSGERIFHVPGQHDYGRVKMNSAAKRWFCSEEEAVAAGWRKARR
jgi:endonuclease YncB( thermonuclease family)